MAVCGVPGCVAMGVGKLSVCSVHLQYARREPGEPPIHCYACGGLIRIGRRLIVRTEGAFHVRLACLTMPQEKWAIGASEPRIVDEAPEGSRANG